MLAVLYKVRTFKVKRSPIKWRYEAISGAPQVIDFTDIDALDGPLKETLHPAIYVQPKDKDATSEDARQATFVATMKRIAKGCRVYAVPNGGKRSVWAAAKAKREGMIAGEPDTGISWADVPTARIEFKNGRSMPTPEQIEALNWYHLRGHPVAVCRTAVGAINWLRSVGAPVPNIN